MIKIIRTFVLTTLSFILYANLNISLAGAPDPGRDCNYSHDNYPELSVHISACEITAGESVTFTAAVYFRDGRGELPHTCSISPLENLVSQSIDDSPSHSTKYEYTFKPMRDTTIKFTCSGLSRDGSSVIRTSSKTRTVEVIQPEPKPSISFSVPSATFVNTDITATWSTENATSCQLKYNSGYAREMPTSGSETVQFSTPGSVNYLFTCQGPGGESSKSTIVTIYSDGGGGNTDPSIDLLYGTNINLNTQTLDMHYATTNVEHCVYNGENIPHAGIKTITIPPIYVSYGSYKTDISLTCYSPSNVSVTRTTTATVPGASNAPRPTPGIEEKEREIPSNTFVLAYSLPLDLGSNESSNEYKYQDYNNDDEADLFIIDTVKNIGYILLNKDGEYPEINKTISGISSYEQIKSIVIVQDANNNIIDIKVTFTVEVTE